jgi:hypothetical protein
MLGPPRPRPWAANPAPVITEIRSAGATSLRGIADALNTRDIAAPCGGRWAATQVRDLLRHSDRAKGSARRKSAASLPFLAVAQFLCLGSGCSSDIPSRLAPRWRRWQALAYVYGQTKNRRPACFGGKSGV